MGLESYGMGNGLGTQLTLYQDAGIEKQGPLLPFMKYFGSKFRLAKYYPAPKFDVLVEPFAGSAGYSLMYWQKRVVLCELNEKMYSIWDYLIRVKSDEIRSLPNIAPGQDVSKLMGIAPEARALIGLWLTWNAAGPRRMVNKFSGWGPRIRERIASQVECIRHWEVYNCSYEQCPYEGPATWFVDPPYCGGLGKHYPCNNKTINYVSLAEWCMSRNGQTIVCEADPAWWLPFSSLRQVKSNTQLGRTMRELIWTNDT